MRFSTELKVPPDEAFTSLVEAFVADAAERTALDDDRRRGLVDAARAGFLAIVHEAMAEAAEPLALVAACTPLHLRVSLFERGLPMDDALARRDPLWDRIADAVDEAHWHSHGAAGSELRLVVQHPRDAAPSDAAHAAPADVPLAPAQEYTIRRFEPADAPAVSRAFYLTYGYHYDVSAVYAPARLIELNALDQYVSIVAIAQDGDVAGHYALTRENGDPIAAGGGAVVLPAHRGRDLLNLMRAKAEEEAARLGLAAYYTEPVTDHGRTQHASESFGARACGITLGELPRNFLAKHMELSATAQRQSFMLYVKPLQPPASRVLHVPRHHQAIVERIYGQLGIPYDLGDGTVAHAHGAFRSSIVRADGVGWITVDRIGADTAQRVHQAVDDLRSLRRLGEIYAQLPLDDPGAATLCEALESRGFFFSGVGPWMLNGRDALRLQMPLEAIDLSALTVVSDFGKELLAYVRAERDRCSRELVKRGIA